MEQVDPIRARIDARIDDLDWGDSFAPLADALRAVLDLGLESDMSDKVRMSTVRRVIAEHLGVTDERTGCATHPDSPGFCGNCE